MMNLTYNDYTDALLGGALIGLSATLLLLGRGRIFGISGILAGTVQPQKGDWFWRFLILVGLVAGGLPVYWLLPAKFTIPAGVEPVIPIVAGLLVGFGTQLGGGCTSGHGVCGMSRLSIRSIVATATFIVAGIVSVLLIGGPK